MKKIIITLVAGMLLSLLISSVAQAELAEIKVGKGTLKMGGNLQAGFTYNLEDAAGTDAFTINRARFLFWGDIIPDKVKYFLQLENKGGAGLLDYKARFFYIEKTEICVGRYIPMFTLYMPSSTAKLELINYPLTTQKFAMWRQVGVTAITKTDAVDFAVGIYNGADVPNNTTDNNDAKDFFGRIDIHPATENMKVRFGGYAWIGKALSTFDSSGVTLTYAEETLKMDRFGGFVKADLENIPVKIRGEFITAKDEFLTTNDPTKIAEIKSMAYFGHISYKVAPKCELLARYDFYDPDTDMDYDAATVGTGDDHEVWLTVGVNHYLDGVNAMFYLNYIHKMEPGDMNTIAGKVEREVDNDLIQVQMQLAF